MPRLLYIFPTAYMSLFFQKGQNEFLKRNGFEMHIATTPDVLLDKTIARDGLIPHPVVITRYASPLHDLATVLRLMMIIHKVQPDIVHVATPKGSLLGILAARFFNKPIKFFACHGTITARKKGIRQWFYKMCEKITVNGSDQVWCVSHSVMDYLRNVNILPPGKGIVFGNGTANGVRQDWLFDKNTPLPNVVSEIQKEKNRLGYPVIGFAGRLCQLKGVDLIAKAWRRLREEHKELRLLLVGEWDQVHPVDSETESFLSDDPRCIITGWVDQGAMGHCYNVMDVFMIPSRGEGFVTVALEASLVGLPVVTTSVLGCIDAVEDDVTGKVISPDCVDELYFAVDTYLKKPDLAKLHGDAGKKRVLQNFQPETIWTSMYDEYIRLLNVHGV